MTPQAYVICTSPRSGSTLLCRLLAATGIAGRPESYFHAPEPETWLEADDPAQGTGVSERETLDRIFNTAISMGRHNDSMMGLRLQRHSFDFFSNILATLYPGHTTDRQRIAAAFGCTTFIHLTRRDKLEQAISYVRAEQSGLWHMSSDGTELERLSPAKTPSYDANRIRRQIEEFHTFDHDWTSWFEREQISPLRLTYEDLATAPNESLRTVLTHLCLDADAADRVKPDVKKLADSINLQWAERFRNETKQVQ